MARTLKIVLFIRDRRLLVAGSMVVRGINSRIRAAAVVKQETLDQAIPTVAVIHPKRGAMKDEIVAAGQHSGVRRCAHLRPHQRISEEVVHRHRHARQRPDSCMAEIESPEVDQQLDAGASRAGHRATPT